MNILSDKLPTNVLIDGVEVQVNTDFRISIAFELLADEDVSEIEKLEKALELYYPVIPGNLNAAVERILWFYKCGKEQKRGKKSSKVLYRFDCDDDYIYSAFLTQYGVDLQEVEYLHWWKFRSMFQGLKEDNEIVKIIGYRAMDISGKMSKEQKRFYQEMKERYKLPISQKKKEKLDRVEEALLNGGDLSGIL